MRITQPKQKGEISEINVIAALISAGYEVLKPYGDNLRYDFVIFKDGILKKCQAKTGRLKNNGQCIRFPCNSVRINSNGYKIENYKGQCDYFAVYCPELRKSFLVPVELCGIREKTLRVEDSDYQNQFGVTSAKDFEILPLEWK